MQATRSASAALSLAILCSCRGGEPDRFVPCKEGDLRPFNKWEFQVCRRYAKGANACPCERGAWRSRGRWPPRVCPTYAQMVEDADLVKIVFLGHDGEKRREFPVEVECWEWEGCPALGYLQYMKEGRSEPILWWSIGRWQKCAEIHFWYDHREYVFKLTDEFREHLRGLYVEHVPEGSRLL